MDLSLVTPNRFVSKKMMTVTVACEFALIIFLWTLWSNRLVPKPLEVIQAIPDVLEGGIIDHMFISLVLCIKAMIITFSISAFFSYLSVVPLVSPISKLMTKGRFLGLSGFIFLFSQIFSDGNTQKLALLVFSMTVFMITSMSGVINDIRLSEYDHARTLRMGPWRVLWEVVVRGRLHLIIEALGQNFAIGWMMLGMVEKIFRGEGGIGVMLADQDKHFMIAEVFVIQLSILSVGMCTDFSIRTLNRWINPWAFINLERK